MTESGDVLLMLAMLLAGVAMLSFAFLKGWEDWLQLRRLELSRYHGARPRPSAASQRLDLIDLKDRVKRLEAIANGVED